MEEIKKINKKTFICLFLCAIFLQVAFSLGGATNFLLAEIPNLDFQIAITAPENAANISGNVSFYAVSTPNTSGTLLDSLDFKFLRSGSYYISYPATKQDQINWILNIDTSLLPNDSYEVYARGFYGSYTYESPRINITVNNSSSAAPLSIGFIDFPTIEISGNKTIYAMANQTVDSVQFKVMPTSGSYTVYTGNAVSGEQYKYYFVWNTTDFSNGNYTVRAIANKSGLTSAMADMSAAINNGATSSAPSFTITAGMEDISSGQIISGTKKVWARSAGSSPTLSLNGLDFKFKNTNSGIYNNFASTASNYENWYGYVDTSILANGNYEFFAEGWYKKSDGTVVFYKSNIMNVSVYNESSAASDISAEFINVPAMPLAGDNKIQIKTNLEPDSVEFVVKKDVYNYFSFSPTKIDALNYSFILKTADFPNGSYVVYAKVKKGMKQIEKYIDASINNASAANPPPAPTVAFIEIPTSPITGDKKIWVSSTQNIDSCKFKIEGPKYAEFPGIIEYSAKCYLPLHSSDFPNGKYTLKSVVYSGNASGETSLTLSIENYVSYTPPASPTTSPSSEPASSAPAYSVLAAECKEKGFTAQEECQKYLGIPLECRQKNILDEAKCKEYMLMLYLPQICVEKNVLTPAECEKVVFLNSLPPECQNKGITTREECEKIISAQNFLTNECRNANIATPEACGSYMMKNFLPEDCQKAEITSKEECDYLLRNKYDNFESIPGKIETSSVNIESAAGFPSECQKENITSAKECKKLIMLSNMPEECRKENAKTKEDCEKIMFKKSGPKECADEKIYLAEDCEKFMFKKYAPDDCREAGILTPEGCKKYMFSKYAKENIFTDNFPIECRKAGAKTAEECEKIMKKTYLPKECKEQGIEEEEKCGVYFKQKYMSKECREAKASSGEECDKIMFRKYAPEECKRAGIEEEEECSKFMFNKYAPKVECKGIDDWQCKNLIKENHIGNIAALQNKFEKVKEETKEYIGKTIKVEDLEVKIIKEAEIIPLVKKDAILKIIAADEKVILNENNDLIQTPPIAFMIDSDEDDLPDDMEKRIGTDPFNEDTDGDGHNDGKEVKNEYDPLGEGKLEKELAPIDQVLLENKVLGHPKSDGDETENLSVETIENVLDKQESRNSSYLLNGKSEPHDVITLYIYSPLPLVVTVKADEFGNWKYELSQSLNEGEHEVYAVINDNTGKVVNKSKPLNFFVKEAKAISVKDFVDFEAEAASETKKESEISLRNYVWAALVIMASAIAIFALVIVKRKKANSANSDSVN